MNTLYYGDNLKILRDYIKDESVDLIYPDPPFNSNRNYNVLFKDESGIEADSQIHAFEDTWHWNQRAEETYHELITQRDGVGIRAKAVSFSPFPKEDTRTGAFIYCLGAITLPTQQMNTYQFAILKSFL